MKHCECQVPSMRAFDACGQLIGCTKCRGWLHMRIGSLEEMVRAEEFFRENDPPRKVQLQELAPIEDE